MSLHSSNGNPKPGAIDSLVKQSGNADSGEVKLEVTMNFRVVVLFILRPEQ